LGKILAVWYAVFLIIELIPSIMVQSNSVASTIEESFSLSPWVTGTAIALIVAIVVFGGVKRVARVTSSLVPFMALFYVLAGLLLILMNASQIPDAIALIFTEAFNP